jgi:hypothetical protein
VDTVDRVVAVVDAMVDEAAEDNKAEDEAPSRRRHRTTTYHRSVGR